MKVDSSLSKEKAIKAKSDSLCPKEILDKQELIEVKYFNFDMVECIGQIVVDKEVGGDVRKVFDLILKTKFPIAKVIPISDKKYEWNDDTSCNDNNSSAFNYRVIAGTSRLSNHALGRAVDLNPLQNPYIKYDSFGVEVFRAPKDAIYDIEMKGTLYSEHEVVELFKNLGWVWGGDWNKVDGPVDYQHFEKH